MAENTPRNRFDEGTTFIGILLGLVLGAIYALLHIQRSGETTRKNLTQFGAGTLDMEIDSSLDDAKQQAHQRLQQSD